MYDRITLAAAGSTGNNTHTGTPLGGGAETVAFQFVVETTGATPTVTWKVQGSPDESSVSDANSSWYDVSYVTDSNDTAAVTAKTTTAVGSQIIFTANPVARRYRKYRLVTSANTNITYHADAFRIASR